MPQRMCIACRKLKSTNTHSEHVMLISSHGNNPHENALQYYVDTYTACLFQVLVGSDLVWQNSSGGQVPPGAVSVGETATGEKLYAGRVLHDGTLTLGKVSLCRDHYNWPWTEHSTSRGPYVAVAYRGGGGFQTPPLHKNYEGPPKSYQSQPDCENW